jgi:hypothetical protein
MHRIVVYNGIDMRPISAVFLFGAVLLFPVHAADVGTETDEILNKGGFDFSRPTCPPVPAFRDVELVTLSQTKSFTAAPFILAARQNGEYIAAYGIREGGPPTPLFLYDTDGDGVLDYKSGSQKYIPWIYYNARLSRSDPVFFSEYCKTIYNQYNSRNGPEKIPMREIINKLTNIILDERVDNRDLYYSLLFYLLNSAKDPELCLGTMLATEKYLTVKYGAAPPLVSLFIGESYYNLRAYKKALAAFSDLKRSDGNSLIGEYYLCRIEQLLNKNSKLLDDFRKANPGFWALKP